MIAFFQAMLSGSSFLTLAKADCVFRSTGWSSSVALRSL
jgi:hypothetical protein